jgi:hypothetical protein
LLVPTASDMFILTTMKLPLIKRVELVMGILFKPGTILVLSINLVVILFLNRKEFQEK